MRKRMRPREVARARELARDGYTIADIADELGRDPRTIKGAVKGDTYSHVPDRPADEISVLNVRPAWGNEHPVLRDAVRERAGRQSEEE